MAKQKSKHGQSPSAPELMRLGEEHLRERGKADSAARALELLRGAEAKLKQLAAPSGKKISIPPHLVAARAALPALLARAHFQQARQARDLKGELAELHEAVTRQPEEALYLLARGAGRLLAGEVAAAGNDFEQAASRLPAEPRAMRARALGHLAAGHARQANELLAAVPESARDAGWQRLATLCGLIGGLDARVDGIRAQFPLLTAMAQLAGEDRAAAAPWFETLPALDHSPARAEAAELATHAFYAGALHLEAGRPAEAISQFRLARQLAEAHRLHLPWLARLSAWCHLAAEGAFADHPELAIQGWELARSLSPDDKAANANLTLARQAQALAAWRAGNLELSVERWQEVLSSRPEDEQALRHLALALERLDRKADALAHWRSLARVWRRKAKGDHADSSLRQRALSLQRHILQLMVETDQPPNDIAAGFEEAVNADPDNLELRKQAVEHLLEMGRGDQALKHLQLLEQRQGASADLVSRQAIALASLRRNDDAIKAFERALALDPVEATARPAFLLFLGNLADQAEEEEEFDRAIQLREKQLAIEPNYPPALLQLASIYFSLNEKPAGEDYIRQVLATAPNDPGVRVRVGAVYLDNNQAKAAAAEFARALKLDSGFNSAHEIGVAYFENDNMKSAFKHFDLAAEKADFNQLIALSTFAIEAGRHKETRRYLDRAKTLAPDNPIPYMVPIVLTIRDPLSFLLGMERMDEMMRDLETAEKLAQAKPEFAGDLKIVTEIKDFLHNGPIANLLAGDEFDDDEEEEGLSGIFPFRGLLPKRRR